MRQDIKIVGRRHAHKESDSRRLGNLIILPRLSPLLLGWGGRIRTWECSLQEHSSSLLLAPRSSAQSPEVAEIAAFEIESTHTIDIDSFVCRSQIDQRFFDTPYYVTPNDPVGQQAFAVIRDAMRAKRTVALGRLVVAMRERVIALEAYEQGLLGTTLRYPYEVRDAKDCFSEIPAVTIAAAMVALAEHILDSKAADFDPAKFQDRYEEALIAHLKARQARAIRPPRETLPALRRVINLMEAPRRSIAQDQKPGRSTFDRLPTGFSDPDANDLDRLAASLDGLALCCCEPGADEAGEHSTCESVGQPQPPSEGPHRAQLVRIENRSPLRVFRTPPTRRSLWR
jgi:Ku protein